MKKLISIIAGPVLLIAFGYAYGGEGPTGAIAENDKMITNDDLPTVTPDQEGATFNQMPADQVEGSAAGGMRSDSETLKKESIEPGKEAVGKPAMKSGREERDTGGYDTGTFRVPGY